MRTSETINFAKEQRKASRRERLGCQNPHCVICGEADERCLERHHLAGRKHDDDTVIVCRNCHRKLSDDQRDHPKPIEGLGVAEVIVHALHGIADLLNLLAEQCRKYAKQLFDVVKSEECLS